MERSLLIFLVLFAGGCAFLRRPDPPVDRTEDPRIRRDVEERLAREPALDASAIRVEVDGRMVILRGSVPGIAGWRCAIANAQLVEGVQSVVDYLALEPGPRDLHCLAPASVPD